MENESAIGYTAFGGLIVPCTGSWVEHVNILERNIVCAPVFPIDDI